MSGPGTPSEDAADNMADMSAPAGWYPDPQPPAPGSSPQQRYWDGEGWTAHVAPTAQQPSYPTTGQQPAYPSYPAGADTAAYGAPGRPTTPDGVPLAGWWHRVGATVIDYLILSVVVAALTFPFLRDIMSAFGDYIDAAVTAADEGRAAPSTTALQSEITGSVVAIGAVAFVVGLIYTIGFLSWKQATPGKLVVGLRIRLRETPGLPFSAIVLRWATQSGVPGLLGLVPLVGFLASLFTLLDVLWPLWDDKNQAIHDKVAKTNVVRAR